MNEPNFQQLAAAEQTLVKEEITKGLTALTEQVETRFDLLKQVADERDKTLESRRQLLLYSLGLITAVIGILGLFGVKQIWDVNARLNDLEARKKDLADQIAGSKQTLSSEIETSKKAVSDQIGIWRTEMSTVGAKSDQINHTVAKYLMTQWIDDFTNIMIYISTQMPKDDYEKAVTTLEHNLELINNLQLAYSQQRTLNGPTPGAAPGASATTVLDRDEQATLLLSQVYHATLSAAHLTNIPRMSQRPDHTKLLNEVEQAWTPWANNTTDEEEATVPHLRAYAAYLLGVVAYRRYDAFHTGNDEIALQWYAKAAAIYPQYSKALSGEGNIHADRFNRELDGLAPAEIQKHRDTLLPQIQTAIDLTNMARSVTTQDRMQSLLENNLATFLYQKANLLFFYKDPTAESVISAADVQVDNALNHESPSPSAYITAAEIKGQHLLINNEWRDENCKTGDAQWDAIIRLVRTACKKHWIHEKKVEAVVKDCPGLKGLEILRSTWMKDLQVILDAD